MTTKLPNFNFYGFNHRGLLIAFLALFFLVNTDILAQNEEIENCNGAYTFAHGSDYDRNARIWFSKGDGTFEEGYYMTNALNLARYGTGSEIFGRTNSAATQWADIDNDGDIDIIHVTEDNNNTFYTYINNGNNTFDTNPVTTTAVTGDGTFFRFAGISADEQSFIKDVDGDGLLDYIFTNDDKKITTWKGYGDGSFSTSYLGQTTLTMPNTSTNGSGLTGYETYLVDDVNGDGKVDYIGTYDDSNTGRIVVWLGNGDGTFNPTNNYTRLLEDTGFSNSSGSDTGEYSQFADVDQDGFLDYCHAEQLDYTYQIWVWKNNGSGEFPDTPAVTTIANAQLPAGGNDSFANYDNGRQSFFIDINEDGFPDYITSNDNEGNNSGITVYLNLAQGGLTFQTTKKETLFTNSEFRTGSNGDLETVYLGCGFASKSTDPAVEVTNGEGTIDCAKTKISPMPVAGSASNHTIFVTINVTAIGTFPLTVEGSGITLFESTNAITATRTGIQEFAIPVQYDGSTALGTVDFTVGPAGSCSADLTEVSAIKNTLLETWTLECVPTAGPTLK